MHGGVKVRRVTRSRATGNGWEFVGFSLFCFHTYQRQILSRNIVLSVPGSAAALAPVQIFGDSGARLSV